MPRFSESYLGRLRQHVGHDLLLSPGAQVLVLDEDGRALLLRRSDTFEWALPAGACEPGASFRTTAARELFEETGVTVDEGALIPFASISEPGLHTIHYPNGDVVHAFALCFWTNSTSAQPLRSDGEASEFVWSDLRLPLPTPTSRVATMAIKLYQQYTETGLFQAR